MLALVSWLRDYVEIPEAPEQLAEALTLAGTAVDGIEQHGDETVLVLDITSNRPDAANHIGLAREIAAIYGRPLQIPKLDVPEDPRPAAEHASIEIEAPEMCHRYVGRVILDVEIKPSPDWIKKRLELCGIRPINNIADLTNYVLLECGHPTHAFDLATLNDKSIIVRQAKPGEELRTLDGVDRNLLKDDLVIADAYRAVALAGVMGGLETEISDSTKDVLIEAAWFEPSPIRKTSRRLALHTEASYRFARGADIEAAGWAADRIASLLAQVSPGAVLKGRIDAYPKPWQAPEIRLRAERLEKVLGVQIDRNRALGILHRLDFGAEAHSTGWTVRIPSHRLDVEREIDLVEEVGRIHGFANIPGTLPAVGGPSPVPKFFAEEAAVRQTVRALGYDETIGYAFQSEEEARQFGWTEPVKLRNPFSELAAVMRTSSVPTMLAAVAHNLHRSEPDVKLAEVGRLYRPEGDFFEEPPILTLVATGAARPASLNQPAKPYDFYELKSDVEAVISRFDLAQVDFDDKDLPSYYTEGRAAQVRTEKGVVAMLGELDPAVCEKRKIRQPVFLAEVFLDQLYPAGLRRPQHRELSKVPPVTRDFSLLVPEGIPFAEIRAAIGPMEFLVAVEPVEIFRGKQVPEGYYSLLLRTEWQRTAESFTDEEINASAAALVQSLDKKLKIQLRS